MKSFLCLLFCCFTWICSSQDSITQAENSAVKKPKNIILLIGDGTGLSQISALHFYNKNETHYDRFPVIGLIKTSASNSLITESAAAATAFASGIKTNNGFVGVDPNTGNVATIVEQVSKIGMNTGVISTSSITHATPACFYAHEESRQSHEHIAMDLTVSDIDFFAGGGLEFFTQRSDEINLISKLERNGFYMDTISLKSSPAMKQGFLLAKDAMPKMTEGRGDFLPSATQTGIKVLSQDNRGFFLMVEGSQVDWGGHRNDAEYLISELIDFDTAIGVALDFAEQDGETLVIVTADHETGGFSLSSDGDNYNIIKPTFSTGGHSATMVPVFAYGPGSELFGGIYENFEINHKMAALLLKQ